MTDAQEPDEPDAWEQFLQQYEWKQFQWRHPELAEDDAQ